MVSLNSKSKQTHNNASFLKHTDSADWEIAAVDLLWFCDIRIRILHKIIVIIIIDGAKPVSKPFYSFNSSRRSSFFPFDMKSLNMPK